jgi:hypothetical protein
MCRSRCVVALTSATHLVMSSCTILSRCVVMSRRLAVTQLVMSRCDEQALAPLNRAYVTASAEHMCSAEQMCCGEWALAPLEPPCLCDVASYKQMCSNKQMCSDEQALAPLESSLLYVMQLVLSICVVLNICVVAGSCSTRTILAYATQLVMS